MGKFFDIAGFHNSAKGCMGIALLFVCSVRAVAVGFAIIFGMGKFFDIAGFHNPAKGCMGIVLLFVCSALCVDAAEAMRPVAAASKGE